MPKLTEMTLRLLAESFENLAKSEPYDFIKTPKDANKLAFEHCARELRNVLASVAAH